MISLQFKCGCSEKLDILRGKLQLKESCQNWFGLDRKMYFLWLTWKTERSDFLLSFLGCCICQVLSCLKDTWAVGTHLPTTGEQVSLFTGHVWNNSQTKRQHKRCVNVWSERLPWKHPEALRSNRRGGYETGKVAPSSSCNRNIALLQHLSTVERWNEDWAVSCLLFSKSKCMQSHLHIVSWKLFKHL